MSPSATYRCPRWDSCGAALCPMYGGSYVKGEETCFFLREYVKAGGPERIRDAVPGDVAEGILSAAPALAIEGSPLYHPLRRAARQGSKAVAGVELRHRKSGTRRQQ